MVTPKLEARRSSRALRCQGRGPGQLPDQESAPRRSLAVVLAAALLSVTWGWLLATNRRPSARALSACRPASHDAPAELLCPARQRRRMGRVRQCRSARASQVHRAAPCVRDVCASGGSSRSCLARCRTPQTLRRPSSRRWLTTATERVRVAGRTRASREAS